MAQNPDMVLDNYEIIFESCFRKHDAIFMLMDGETDQLMDANDAALRFYGYSLKQIRSMKIGDINKLPPEELDAEQQKAVREEKKYFIVPHLLANGEVRTVEVHTTPIVLKNKKYLFSVIHDITKRKKTEEALIESENRYRELFNHANDCIYTIDLNGQFLTVNDVLVKAMKCDSAREVLESNMSKWMTPESLVKTREFIREVITTDDYYNEKVVIEIIRKDGKHVWFEHKARPLKDKNDNIIGLHGIGRDVTEWKLMEKELQKNKAMLEKAQELGCMGSWDWDITTNNVIWSDEVYKIYGLDLKKDKPDYKTVIDTLTPECRKDFLRAIEDTLKRGKPFEGDYSIICKDGTRKYTHTKGEVVLNKGGNAIRMFGMVQDITASKLAEKDLRQIEIKLQAILESTADGILAVDNNGKVINANQRFMELWRIPRSLMDTRDDNALLDFVLEQLIDPDVFLKKVKLLYGTDRDDMDTLYFKDGRIFERFSSRLIMGGGIFGRVWSFRDVTERKKSEEFNQIQARILENLSEGVNLTDEKGNICFTNDKFDKMFGYKKNELIGANIGILNAYSKKENIKFVEDVIKNLKVKGKWFGEVLNRKKNGSIFYTRVNMSIAKFGDKTRFICIQGDITGLKKDEEKLKASEEKYSNLVEKGNDGIIIMQDNVLKYLNSIVCRMTGFTRDELLGKPFINYVSLEYKKIVMERYEKRLKGYDIPNIYEIEILAKGGRKTQVEVNASQIEYEGRPASMAIIRDITERKTMERAIIESEERYRTLIENIELGITLIDKNHRIVMANNEFCKRTGILKDKTEGEFCYKICAKRDSVCSDCPGIKAMALKKVVKVESEYISYDGSCLPVIIHAFPVLGSNNEAKAFIEITEDISEYKKVEKAKKNLIRDLSHGLKTPVSMIEMSLGIIKNSMDSGDKENLMKAKRIADENIKKVRKDLNGILYEFSMDVKKEVLSESKRVSKKASLKNTMKEVVKNIRSAMELKKLKLKISIPPNADKIKINNNDLWVLLNNLFDNAMKFTKKGEISIISRCKGKMIEIIVKDTGCGISNKDINRVFDRFYKRHASIDGTGLGLTICKKLVEMYNGEINVLSEGMGKGTKVIVRLPKV